MTRFRSRRTISQPEFQLDLIKYHHLYTNPIFRQQRQVRRPCWCRSSSLLSHRSRIHRFSDILDIYDGTGDFLRGLDVDEDTFSKAIIGKIGDVDSYQLPDAKGYRSLLRHLLNVTDEERQQRREEILSTSLNDFKEFTEAIDSVRDKGVAVVVASQEDIDAANKERSNFFEEFYDYMNFEECLAYKRLHDKEGIF